MAAPLVSVIIPVYNAAAWLEECLGSVLEQTYAPIEVIVIDDGSTDETASILRRFQPAVVVIDQQRGGVGAARNLGLQRAQGEFVAFLDHDDLWRKDKLAIQVSQVQEHPETVVSYTDAEEFDDRGALHRSFFDLFPGLRDPGRIFHEIIHLAVPLTSTVLIRRLFLEQHGLSFRESAAGVDDVGLFLEIADRAGGFDCIDEPLTFRRMHGNNLSKSHYNRFAKRVLLYRWLQDRIRQPAHQRMVAWGLRDACFRVAEWHWGELALAPARQHFQGARGLDGLGLRATGLGLASRLPVPMVRWLQKTKRKLVG